MKIYIIYDDKNYALYPNRRYRLGNTSECDINLEDLLQTIDVKITNDLVAFDNKEYYQGVHDIKLGIITLKLVILNKEQYYLLNKGNIFIGSKEDSDIYLKNSELNILLNYEDEIKIVADAAFYLNGQKVSGKVVLKEHDDIIFPEGISIKILNGILELASNFEIKSRLISFSENEKEEDRAKEFHRSPRIILREPSDKVIIGTPPTEEEEPKQSLLRLLLMPAAMIFFTILMYMYSSSGAMMIMMFGMSTVTIITSIQGYIADKKRFKEREIKKVKDYKDYLEEKYIELENYKEEQKQSLEYHYPEMDRILAMPKKVDRRIYEKTPYYFDFLTYKLGKGEIRSSFSVEYSKSETSKVKEEILKDINELLDHYQYISNVPIKNDIHVPTGYIGTRKVAIEQVQQLMMQIAVFQSYHDVQFIPIFREEELSLWNWSRWLPHIKIKAFNSRGFIYNQKTRDQLLTSLYQIIKERKLDFSQTTDKSKEKLYTPHYVLIITDLSLLLDHNIMEYIHEDLTQLGISFIFVEEVIESLPEHVKTVVDYRSDKKGILILHKGEFEDKQFIPLPAISTVDKERFARNLAGINHEETLRNSIPNSITFLEMYGAKTVEDLNILNRWEQNETYQTMAVPLGIRGRDDLLYLNLHEKAHGPHGLIAGTTGSGKSELIQSYILSLAVNYHPYEIAFLLIDYKGGGMANLFSELPHLVGTITNLDANQAERALISIKAELKKRQRIFSEHDVNHINQYTKLYKQGNAEEPLPHLFIISDEFAELKQEQPDFMQELISTARIGRSLGIHLILATQKPSGVVNDQIWSNSKFKIALKVQDVADSREIIKTPDAANITQTGRAYLQVGNNEIYELFQSAWSGADYNIDKNNSSNRDLIVYEIKGNGQYNPINKDLSGLSRVKEVKTIPTELDVVVSETKSIFKKIGLPKVASPWLPPLEENIYSDDLQNNDFKKYWNQNKDELNILVGYQDIPEKQEQSPLYFDIEHTGHIMLVSSPGFGKSTFLQNFAVDIMRKKNPEEVHLYLYDFGTSGLVSLSDFPHVADYFTLDEFEKIMKSLRRLNAEVRRRKKILGKEKATNLKQYNQISKEKIPSIFVVVDSFDGMVDSKFSEAFYETLNIIARDGASLGIYIVTTLSRINAMRLQLQANFKTKISLFLFDKSDLSAVVGRSNIHLDEIKGRAVTKFDEITYFQVVQPYKIKSYANYINQVTEEVKEMRDYWSGQMPKPIPMLPEKITFKVIEERFSGIELSKKFILGLYRETAEVATFLLDKSIMITSDNPLSVLNYYSLLDYNIERFGKNYKAILFDPVEKIGTDQLKNAQRLIDPLEIENEMNNIVFELKQRIENPREWYSNYLVIIPDIVSVYREARISEQDFKLLVKEGSKYGITLLFVGHYQDLVGNYDMLVKQIKQLVEQVYIGIRITDQDHTRYPYIANEPYLKPNEGYILTPQTYDSVQIIEKINE
ncbi:type VII secretion protein EssC [Gemella cuniculi]|uniref:type VII secretion protein EssC n=1 Tax=Gemella cuniculi TaxID=150240 RepID=UPI0003FA8B30|nr:type VII secretion protein EssC [Gemella cuniculi]